MYYSKKLTNFQDGQALIALLAFIVISVTVISGAVVIMITNSLAATKMQQGMIAAQVADGGAENALIRLLRDPSYTGETLTVGDGTATITVTGTTSKTITSEGKVGSFIRKTQIVTSYTNNVLTVTSWKEVF